ncbi:MAG: hypothetical protein QXH80_02415 [Candidatus Nanoarchaeia archaeon]
MSNKITLLDNEKITYEGVFDLGEIYKHAHQWFTWRKYDVSEKKYKEKMKPTGKEIEIEWSVNRDIDEYSKFTHDIKWRLRDVNDVEVQKDSTKIKMQKGEINFEITSFITTDRQDFWVTKPHFAFLKAFYEKYLYKGSIERMKKEIWKHGWEFYNEMKAFLNLYKYG